MSTEKKTTKTRDASMESQVKNTFDISEERLASLFGKLLRPSRDEWLTPEMAQVIRDRIEASHELHMQILGILDKHRPTDG